MSGNVTCHDMQLNHCLELVCRLVLSPCELHGSSGTAEPVGPGGAIDLEDGCTHSRRGYHVAQGSSPTVGELDELVESPWLRRRLDVDPETVLIRVKDLYPRPNF